MGTKAGGPRRTRKNGPLTINLYVSGFLFFIFVFYKKKYIFVFEIYKNIPGLPAAGRPGPGRPVAGRRGFSTKNFVENLR